MKQSVCAKHNFIVVHTSSSCPVCNMESAISAWEKEGSKLHAIIAGQKETNGAMDAIRQAYDSGYSKGHNDTVESTYSPEQSCDDYITEQHQQQTDTQTPAGRSTYRAMTFPA
ncbi:MAG: hypothetical protein IMZ61_02060 [Planctomycetes bacterium]|nr:hypothetical protein [Planctomycetota bacterium]